MRQGHLFIPFALTSLFAISSLAQAQSSSFTTIASSPAGAQFSVDGQNYTQPVSAVWPQGSKHTLSALPVQSDPATGAQYTFNSWTWSGGSFTQPQVTVTADPSITKYTAVFGLAYQLSVIFNSCSNGTFSPGTVIVNGISYTCDAQVFVSAGSQAVIQATPSPGYVFAGWGNGNGQTIIGFQNTLTINSPVEVFPIFAPTRDINIATSPQGLTVLADRTPIATPYTLQWGFSTVHTLGAITPQRDLTGNWWVFSSWSDGGALNHAYTVASVTTPDTVTATYVPGAGATFTTSPGGLNLTVDGVTTLPPYNFVWGVGETHTFSAPATQTDSTGHAWTFSGWSNNGPASQSVTVPASAVALGYRYIATYAPMGHLSVSSAVPSAVIYINANACASPCDVKLPVGTQVDISATPSVPNGPAQRLDLSGWTGSASGGAGDLMLTLGADPVTVTANYKQMNYLAMASNPSSSVKWSIQPISSDGYYDAASTVNLAVTAMPGYKFLNWTGDLAGTAPAGSVQMNSPRSVTAMTSKVPYVSPAGVENGVGNTPVNAVAPGSVVSVFGANMASTTVVGQATPLQQSLGGITATIGDQIAPLYFASPNQINLQLPNLQAGSQTLVISGQGQPTVQVTFTVARNAPGLFLQTINNQSFAIAYHADGSAITQSAPAQIGETITVYGTGFGPTTPDRLEGFAIPATPVYNVVDTVSVAAGSVTAPATASYALAGSVGIDVVQFTLTDPTLSGTNATVSVSINGQASNSVLVPVQ
jgi:uncharacterized protein (TIGR03437 family)